MSTEETPFTRLIRGLISYVAISHSRELGIVSEVMPKARIGKLENLRRCTSIFTLGGRDDCARDIAALTRCNVLNMSIFQSKKRSTSALPRLVMERTLCRP